MRLAILIAAVLALYLWAAVLLGTVLRNRRRAAEERARRVRDMLDFYASVQTMFGPVEMTDDEITRAMTRPSAPYHAGRRIAA